MEMDVVLFDSYESRMHLMPLVTNKPIAMLRVGALCIKEKWALSFAGDVHLSLSTHPSLQAKYPNASLKTDSVLCVDAAICPDKKIMEALEGLRNGECLRDGDGQWMAFRVEGQHFKFEEPQIMDYTEIHYGDEYIRIRYFEDLLRYNSGQLISDIALLGIKKHTSPLSSSNIILGDNLILSNDVYAEASTFNTLAGPIYISDGAVIEEGSHLRGPLYIGENSVVKMGSMVYGNVSIGPNCTVGGEIKNSIILANSNKGHEGYLGSSLIGEYCNIGAGTNVSNLQNTYSELKLYDYRLNEYRQTQEYKFGVVMGDYTMCGVNTSFTTGSVIGIGVQLAKTHIIDKWVPDFTWQTDHKNETYRWDGFVKMLRNKFIKEQKPFKKIDQDFLQEIYNNCTLKNKN